MQVLGFPLTWRTPCFLPGGCDQIVYAHTNGHGDFVLFDSLGWPWPVHSCYASRLDTLATGSINIGSTRVLSYNGQLHRPWDIVTPIEPSRVGRQKRFHLLGTVTHVERGFLTKAPQFRGLHGPAKDEVHRALAGRTSLITVVTGSGEEYAVLLDLKKTPCSFGDIVVVDAKIVKLLSDSAFVATQLRVFHSGP